MKSKRAKIVVLVGVIIVLFVYIITNNKQKFKGNDLKAILENGRIAVLTDSSSYGFAMLGDSIFGFQYEMVKIFADSLGVELVIGKQSNLEKAVSSLQRKDYHIIASFIPLTTEWKNDLLYTVPLYRTRQMLVQRKTDSTTTISKQYELNGDTVYILAGSPNRMRLQHLESEIAGKIHVVEIAGKSIEQLVEMVSDGIIKYTICPEIISTRMNERFKNLDTTMPIGFSQDFAWAVHPESANLLLKLNLFLEEFIGSRKYWELYRKYY